MRPDLLKGIVSEVDSERDCDRTPCAEQFPCIAHEQAEISVTQESVENDFLKIDS